VTGLGGAWLIAPVALPLTVAALALLPPLRPLAGALQVVSLLALAALALGLGLATADGTVLVQLLGNWPAPFGITLVADRLTTLMLGLTALVALASVVAAGSDVATRGPFFVPFFQVQLAGLNGAFLTGDLFNLFVCFELLLAASYALLLHGNRPGSARAGLHYVAVNLVASAVFLIGVGLVYGVAGTLNLADLALRIPALGHDAAAIAAAGGLLLALVFATKAALVPLGFWLPAAYAAPLVPVAALFALLTKVGIYALLRVSTLLFPGLADPILLGAGATTLLVAGLGALAAADLRHLAAWLIVASAGTLAIGLGLGSTRGTAAVLLYLPHSTLAAAALMLVAELLARSRGSDSLVPGPRVTRTALVGGLYLVAAATLAGLPPFSGFVAKVFVLRAALGSGSVVIVWAAVLTGGLLALLALMRAGSRWFWEPDPSAPPAGARPLAAPAVACAGLLAAGVALVVFATPAERYARATAQALRNPVAYIDAVFAADPVDRAVDRGVDRQPVAAGGAP
jgi:multicomponent K+:H+ antiporter subunit D